MQRITSGLELYTVWDSLLSKLLLVILKMVFGEQAMA